MKITLSPHTIKSPLAGTTCSSAILFVVGCIAITGLSACAAAVDRRTAFDVAPIVESGRVLQMIDVATTRYNASPSAATPGSDPMLRIVGLKDAAARVAGDYLEALTGGEPARVRYCESISAMRTQTAEFQRDFPSLILKEEAEQKQTPAVP